MFDVYFYEAFKEEAALLKKFLPRHIKAGFSWQTPQERKDKTPPAPILSIRTQSKIPLEWAPKLKGILTRSQGVDHLQRFLKQASRPVACGYLVDYCSRAVAEHAVMTAMALLRKLNEQVVQFKTFHRDDLTGREIKNTRVLVVGVGGIGRQAVDILKGLKARVKGVDPIHRLSGLEYVSLSEGIKWAEVVIVTLPLTNKTRGLLNFHILKKTTPGAVVINVSRGEITPIKNLKRLLNNGHLGGVSLDVYEEEDELAHALRKKRRIQNINHKTIMALSQLPQCLFTPHNAFNSQQAVEEKARQSVISISRFLQSGKFPHPV